MQFTVCENTGFYLRLALLGPSGSGKTYTALKLATELGFEKVGIIDTENRSARRYARTFNRRFQSLELSHFSPRDYIEAMHTAHAAGIEVLIIDSLSHAWMGKGGVLEMVDQSAKRQSRGNGGGSSFNGWREVTPEHNRLVEALIQTPIHMIVTLRVKTEYVVEKDQGGKSVPRKVGLAPVQRDGLEYEFDIAGEISPDHELMISKSRCPALTDAIIKMPGAPMAQDLRAWLDGAAPREEEAETPHEERTVEREDAPAPAAGDHLEELRIITPWLHKIHEAEEQGSEEQLNAVREEMNGALKRRTKAQGEALRRAIETARAAIHARPDSAPL